MKNTFVPLCRNHVLWRARANVFYRIGSYERVFLLNAWFNRTFMCVDYEISIIDRRVTSLGEPFVLNAHTNDGNDAHDGTHTKAFQNRRIVHDVRGLPHTVAFMNIKERLHQMWLKNGHSLTNAVTLHTGTYERFERAVQEEDQRYRRRIRHLIVRLLGGEGEVLYTTIVSFLLWDERTY